MDLAQVEAILGAGTKDSSYTAAGEVTEGYTWCGDVERDYLNSPVVEITFVDGKVDIVQPTTFRPTDRYWAAAPLSASTP